MSDDRFVFTIPLIVSPKDEKILLSRLEAARQVYNACLGECFKRLRLMKESKFYQLACETSKKTDNKKRKEAFRKAEQQAKYSEYDLYAYTKQFNYSWLRYHLDSQINRKLAKRAFDAVNRWRFGVDKPCRNGGACTRKDRNCYLCCMPRFKKKGSILTSVEGTNNVQSIHWNDGKLVWNSSARIKLELPGIIDYNDNRTKYALSKEIKYVRLLRCVISGRNVWYAQLVLDGVPYQEHSIGTGEVGLDIGPSTIAIVSEFGTVELKRFCDELEDRQKEIRRLQRKLDRQRRANNPDNYNDNGTPKRGVRWKKSNGMLDTQAKIAELHRKQAAHRKSLHGELCNHILSLGNVIKLEKLSYKAWQRNRRFAKSVQFRAPGMFVAMLKRKAKAAGVTVIEFGTYHTKFSQLDHTSGEIHPENAELSVRYKTLSDGTFVQRDLYSAFLAMCYDAEIDNLNADLTRERWSGDESRQQVAFRELLREHNGQRT